MERSQSFMQMMEASARIQFNISLILEAKAFEAERSRDWVCLHVADGAFGGHDEQLQKSIEIHEQFIETIEGLTKLELALAKSLKIVLNKQEESGGEGFDGGGFGNLLPMGGGM
ncbi:restriction endonuclease subunit S [Paenibacillus flagellatus]|uniref:Restriction endonuclease subunit S n=1 Tax=Paenibacillus flagellatus TaxID=2211139 RepID=A0A2V5K3F0_9BACL|nr:restriction endonuclease subunit S [Paenibacillus flagellatus]PYI52133.1 restriction endonuclease subunit S [Paenibacillus flagellatus]